MEWDKRERKWLTKREEVWYTMSEPQARRSKVTGKITPYDSKKIENLRPQKIRQGCHNTMESRVLVVLHFINYNFVVVLELRFAVFLFREGVGVSLRPFFCCLSGSFWG